MMETLALPIQGGNPEQHNMRTTSCSLICVADGLAFQMRHAKRKKKRMLTTTRTKGRSGRLRGEMENSKSCFFVHAQLLFNVNIKAN